MDLTQQLYLAGAAGALGLGIAVLARAPHRARHRVFALLCLALATWLLGVLVRHLVDRPPRGTLAAVYLAGSCAAAPLALHFVLLLTGRLARRRRLVLGVAWAAAGATWLASFVRDDHGRTAWAALALVVLGGTLATALLVLARHAAALPPGPARRAHAWLVAAGLLAAVTGLSDIVPNAPWPVLGPGGLLVFLLVVSATLLRRGLLDVDAVVARAITIAVGAAVTSAAILLVTDAAPRAALPTFAIVLVVLALSGPLGRRVAVGASTLLRRGDDPAGVLLGASRRLAAAETTADVTSVFDDVRASLSPELTLELLAVARDAGEGSRPTAAAVGMVGAATLDADDPLVRFLDSERGPVDRALLADEARDASRPRRGLARDAADSLVRHEAAIAAPLLRGRELAGVVLLGGRVPPEMHGAEAGAALVAVGQQAIAALDRLDALEAARRQSALASVGEMAAGLAHELRNPAGAIRGAAQVLRDGGDPETQREMLAVIDEESTRLGRVVGDFLDYARPHSPRREPIDLRSVLEAAARAVGLSGLSISLTVEDDSAPRASGDPEQLRRCFENLVRNAAEAAGPDGTLHVVIEGAGPDRVRCTLTDDGPGFHESDLPRLFEPFQTTRPGGTGLGLALVHRVVEAHGGRVTAGNRTDGRGARFVLDFPAAPREGTMAP